MGEGLLERDSSYQQYSKNWNSTPVLGDCAGGGSVGLAGTMVSATPGKETVVVTPPHGGAGGVCGCVQALVLKAKIM